MRVRVWEGWDQGLVGDERGCGRDGIGVGGSVGFPLFIFFFSFLFSIDKWMDGCGMMDGWMGAMSSIRVKPTPPMGIEYM